jgi:hypothetical protein
MARIWQLLAWASLFSISAWVEVDVGETCISPIMFPRAALDIGPRCIHSLLNKSFEGKTALAVPKLIQAWGSNGLLGDPWAFADEHCNEYFANLFETIGATMPRINLTPHDLFHAHMLGYEHDGAPQVALVFHAQEYPNDLSGIKNYYRPPGENFYSHEDGFKERNFIFLSHKETIYLVKNEGECSDFFDKDGGNYLSERLVRFHLPGGRSLGDVNYFLLNRLNTLKYRFFSGPDEFFGIHYADLEGMMTGKSVARRLELNEELHSWVADIQNMRTLYFLTGASIAKSSPNSL